MPAGLPSRRADPSRGLPKAHARQPSIGWLNTPAVFCDQRISDGGQHVNALAFVAAALERSRTQGVTELRQIQLSQEVAQIESDTGVSLWTDLSLPA